MIGRSLLTMMRIVSLYLMPGFVPGIRAFLASSFRMPASARPGISRFRVRGCASPRNDGGKRGEHGRFKPSLDVETASTCYGAIEIGEKSTNQLFGCTNPFTFALIARGATSWAT